MASHLLDRQLDMLIIVVLCKLCKICSFKTSKMSGYSAKSYNFDFVFINNESYSNLYTEKSYLTFHQTSHVLQGFQFPQPFS